MKGMPSLGPWPLTQVILATDIWLGLMVDLVPSLRSSASSCVRVHRETREVPATPETPPSSVLTPRPSGLGYLVEGDKLRVQAHQVPNLWHLIQHQGNKSSMCFPLLPC